MNLCYDKCSAVPTNRSQLSNDFKCIYVNGESFDLLSAGKCFVPFSMKEAGRTLRQNFVVVKKIVRKCKYLQVFAYYNNAFQLVDLARNDNEDMFAVKYKIRHKE